MLKITFGIATRITSEERKLFLYEAIDSILKQTNPNWEIIISDDDSIIKPDYSLFTDNRITIYYQKKSLGIFKNFDFCLKKTHSELFLPLGDDDLIENNFVEKILSFYEINQNKEIDFICMNYKNIDPFGNILNISNINDGFQTKGREQLNKAVKELFNYSKNLKKMFFCSVVNTNSLKKIGGYPDYGLVTDIYIIFLFSYHFNYGFCNDNLIKIRQHSGNASGINKIEQLKNELLLLSKYIHRDYYNFLTIENQKLFENYNNLLLYDHVGLLLSFQKLGRLGGINSLKLKYFSFRHIIVLLLGIFFGKKILKYYEKLINSLQKLSNLLFTKINLWKNFFLKIK